MNSKNELVPIVADMTVHQVGNFYQLSDDEVIQILNANCPWQVYLNRVREMIRNECTFKDPESEKSCSEGGVEWTS